MAPVPVETENIYTSVCDETGNIKMANENTNGGMRKAVGREVPVCKQSMAQLNKTAVYRVFE
jgi:hypothetical protein